MLPFLYPLKIPENQKFFWRFQGVKNGNIRQKWVKFGEDVSISEKFGSALHLDESFIVTNRKKYVWICPQAVENTNTTQGTIFT